ncbi:MAG: hypothetical protein J5699_00510 [Bacteroidales bacterium]|nr:hypothetical protein [Bacteroidales bacterium]
MTEKKRSWWSFFDFNENSIGKRGEFANNDEDLAIEEEMRQLKSVDHDADLQEHFGWENEMNYDADKDDDDW